MRGFARVSVAVPVSEVADVERNARATLELWRQADQHGSTVVVFPELGLSAYSVRDLSFDQYLLDGCERALAWLADEGCTLSTMALVGLPIRSGGGLYNIAAAIQGGHVLGVVHKA